VYGGGAVLRKLKSPVYLPDPVCSYNQLNIRLVGIPGQDACIKRHDNLVLHASAFTE